jgi:septum formation inhibitor MinC
MSTIIINGKSITCSGNNINCINGTLYVNGIVVEKNLSGKVEIMWSGELATLSADGNVTCGAVQRNVSSGGNIHITGDVNGNINAGGNITIYGTINGQAIAGGNISSIR